MDEDWDVEPTEGSGSASFSMVGPRRARTSAKTVKKKPSINKPAPKKKPATTRTDASNDIPLTLQQVTLRAGGVRVASDCSGWCSELWAFQGLDLSVESVFCSEIDAGASRFLKHIWGEDVNHVFKDRVGASGIQSFATCGPFNKGQKHISNMRNDYATW